MRLVPSGKIFIVEILAGSRSNVVGKRGTGSFSAPVSVSIDGTGVGVGVFTAVGLRVPSLVLRGGYITGALGNGSSIIIFPRPNSLIALFPSSYYVPSKAS